MDTDRFVRNCENNSNFKKLMRKRARNCTIAARQLRESFFLSFSRSLSFVYRDVNGPRRKLQSAITVALDDGYTSVLSRTRYLPYYLRLQGSVKKASACTRFLRKPTNMPDVHRCNLWRGPLSR